MQEIFNMSKNTTPTIHPDNLNIDNTLLSKYFQCHIRLQCKFTLIQPRLFAYINIYAKRHVRMLLTDCMNGWVLPKKQWHIYITLINSCVRVHTHNYYPWQLEYRISRYSYKLQINEILVPKPLYLMQANCSVSSYLYKFSRNSNFTNLSPSYVT